MTARNLILGAIGVILALWMGLGRWAFGIGGQLSWWYVPLITLPYALLQLWTVRRLKIAKDRGRRAGRAPFVTLALSWLCALGFGLTAPDLPVGGAAGATGGDLASVLTHLAGDDWLGMSIALCNPLGIIAMTTAIVALAFAFAAGREPRPEEDELLEAAGQATESGMVPHPLSRDS